MPKQKQSNFTIFSLLKIVQNYQEMNPKITPEEQTKNKIKIKIKNSKTSIKHHIIIRST